MLLLQGSDPNNLPCPSLLVYFVSTRPTAHPACCGQGRSPFDGARGGQGRPGVVAAVMAAEHATVEGRDLAKDKANCHWEACGTSPGVRAGF